LLWVFPVSEGEATPGIPAEEYERRRKSLMDKLPENSIVVSVAAPVKYMSGRTYRHHFEGLCSVTHLNRRNIVSMGLKVYLCPHNRLLVAIITARTPTSGT
jgi:hypothetical protein